jgi:hypothetical protein
MSSLVVRLAFVALALTPSSAGVPQVCTVPCSHPVHPWDAGPCNHACAGPWGPVPCHQYDMYPCGHRVHSFDYVQCMNH